MDASEARELTDENLRGPVIERYCLHINLRIRKAAHEGVSSIHNPQVSDSTSEDSFYIQGDEVKAVRIYYEDRGFEWTDHPDPDPGHPCSGAYTTLSW